MSLALAEANQQNFLQPLNVVSADIHFTGEKLFGTKLQIWYTEGGMQQMRAINCMIFTYRSSVTCIINQMRKDCKNGGHPSLSDTAI